VDVLFCLFSESLRVICIGQARKILVRYIVMQGDRMPIDQVEDHAWSELMLYKKIYGVSLGIGNRIMMVED
jgi:hypothetical protein